MKMNAKSIIVLALACSTTLILRAQTPDFSGVWILSKKINLSGQNYGNAVPKQIRFEEKSDSIIVERLYDGPTGDYTISESLSIDGKPTSNIRPNNTNRLSVLRKGNDSFSFLIEVSYRDINTGKQTSVDFTERWKLNDEKQLELEKKAQEPNGQEWQIKGIYALKTKEQTAYEQATGKGIQFIQNVNWEKVKETAKKENKYIFVDCFATWCVPCKKMEADVFRLNIIGDSINNKFISVRVQMDTTKKDNEEVQRWYETAHNFLSQYDVIGYPTFLFFDSEGNIVHKAMGTFTASEFATLLNDVRNPSKQYYTLVNDYRKGKKNYIISDYLAMTAKSFGDTKLAEEILKDYKNNFLSKLPVDSLLSEKYLKLANTFQPLMIQEDGSNGVFFVLLYKKGEVVDQILNQPGFSTFHLNRIITKEEIEDKIYIKGKPISNPNWGNIKSALKSKYSKVDPDKFVLNAQIQYYRRKKDWKNEIRYLAQKVDKYGPLSLGNPDGSGSDNVISNTLLPHCDDIQILRRAVGWIEQIIHSSAYMYPVGMVYGNYGGILYKAGHKKEGIAAFEKHLNAIGYKSPADIDKDPRYRPKVEILKKMKRGEKIDYKWNVSAFF